MKDHYVLSTVLKNTLLGVGNDPIPIKREITIKLKPWFDSYEVVTANFLILPPSNTWRPILPPGDVQCAIIRNPVIKQLADPLFWKAEAVSAILGI